MIRLEAGAKFGNGKCGEESEANGAFTSCFCRRRRWQSLCSFRTRNKERIGRKGTKNGVKNESELCKQKSGEKGARRIDSVRVVYVVKDRYALRKLYETIKTDKERFNGIVNRIASFSDTFYASLFVRFALPKYFRSWINYSSLITLLYRARPERKKKQSLLPEN